MPTVNIESQSWKINPDFFDFFLGQSSTVFVKLFTYQSSSTNIMASKNNNQKKDEKKTPYYAATHMYKFLTTAVDNIDEIPEDERNWTSSKIADDGKIFCTHSSLALPAKDDKPASTFSFAKVYIERPDGSRHQPELLTPPMKLVFNPEGAGNNNNTDGVSVSSDSDNKEATSERGKLVLCCAASALDGQDERDALSDALRAYLDKSDPECYSAERMQAFIDDLTFFDQHALRAIVNQGQQSDDAANWAAPSATVNMFKAMFPKEKPTTERLAELWIAGAKGSISEASKTKAGKDVPPLLRARIKLVNNDISFAKAQIYKVNLETGDYITIDRPEDGHKYVHESLSRGAVIQCIISEPTGNKSGTNLSLFWFASQVLILQPGTAGGPSKVIENKFNKRPNADAQHEQGPDVKKGKFSV